MDISQMRLLLLSLHIAIATVSANFTTVCDNLAGDSFYENGKCYTVHIVPTPVSYDASYNQCTDIQDDVRNVGLAMWLPDTVKPWLLSVPGMKLALIAIRTTALVPSAITYVEMGDTFRFTQARTLDDGPSWPAKIGTQTELFQPVTISEGNMTIDQHMCMFYGDYGNGPMLAWSWCEATNSVLNAFVCVYESSKDVRITLSLAGHRMASGYVISETIERSDNVLDCSHQLMRVCAACHSFAYSKATGVCQLYIPDSRVIGYDAMLVADGLFDVWQYE